MLHHILCKWCYYHCCCPNQTKLWLWFGRCSAKQPTHDRRSKQQRQLVWSALLLLYNYYYIYPKVFDIDVFGM